MPLLPCAGDGVGEGLGLGGGGAVQFRASGEDAFGAAVGGVGLVGAVGEAAEFLGDAQPQLGVGVDDLVAQGLQCAGAGESAGFLDEQAGGLDGAPAQGGAGHGGLDLGGDVGDAQGGAQCLGPGG
ncbi:hypothetical protein [Actinokineospora globicatena]|uniref:hypothetical protein n=1 Tax=Actinokineospora globicatena TaxID=103729 RepID=UPI0020A2D179|nr:hypothetical protein [Actinokineospora globicatena]